ncbi:serine--tRNA ligase [Candidatus Jorgensenbacteria bacterium]|nr:serine--tRNA ligase [Candidatus Jorgensenbacteria bacterium]
MLDIAFIRQNSEKVKEGIAKKNADPKLIDKFLRLDEEWRMKTAALDQLKADQNSLGKELATKKRDDLLSKAEVLKKRVQEISLTRDEFAAKREAILRSLPNIPIEDVPVGKDETENKIVKEVGKIPSYDFIPKDYLLLGEELGLIDVGRAAKTSGSRFGYLFGDAALLEFGLVKLALDTLRPKGFVPVVPPVLIKDSMMGAMGYVDRREDMDETYFLDKDKLYLVGTSEQSIGPMHADEVFEESELSKRYVAFSTCFRREAGSYGKDTKGILRVHQFDKVEMFSFCHPDQSIEEHKLLLSLEEKLMKSLEIPYRVVEMCTGDLGNVAAAKFDIEAWLPSQNQYRETHSTSNATDFQARRLNIKFKPKDVKQKSRYVHTLNGTAFAIGRTIIAIIENYQTKKGTIRVPEVLRGYLGKEEIGRG